MLTLLAAAPVLALPASVAAATPDTVAWEQALSAYYWAKSVYEHEEKYGAVAAAYKRYDQAAAPFFAKYGMHDKCKALGTDKVEWDAMFQEMCAAEEWHAEEFARPRWAAFDVVKATPAPTIAALLLKLELHLEEDGEDGLLGLIQSDLRRLGGL
jgi:hypothetical protein